MPPIPFALVPFPGEKPPLPLAVTGTVDRAAGSLAFRCVLSGDLSRLSLPPPGARRERRDRLWERTCFELFLREEGAAGYVEFNLSPSGRWNAYRFDSPRSGMREERSLASLPFAAERGEDVLSVALDLPLGGLFPDRAVLLAAASAVLRSADGAATHWALAHPAGRPDFHHPGGFLLRLPPPTERPGPTAAETAGQGGAGR